MPVSARLSLQDGLFLKTGKVEYLYFITKGTVQIFKVCRFGVTGLS